MSSNKLMQGIALALISIALLPPAYAQTFSGSTLFFILVNTAVIAVVLFILQAFLVPGKTDKERASVWGIIIAVSLLIAWFFGSQGLIWQTGPIGAFFKSYAWYKVLGNALAIGAVLYFLLGWLDVPKRLGSAEGKTGYALLLFIIAFMLALKMGNSWLWEQGTIGGLINYFLGDEGILTLDKNRIFVFIGSGVLLAWFFNFIAIGKENKTINYILAFLFAAHLASGAEPYTIDSIKNLVLIIGTWILGSNLSEKFTGQWKVAGYGIAFFLVYWAVFIVEAAVTPEGRAVAAEKGWLEALFGTFWSSKWILVLGIIVLMLLFVIGRGELRNRHLSEGLTRVWTQVLQKLKRNRVTAKIVGDYFKMRDRTLPGELPFALKELRLEIYTLMNYMLRHEIYKAKLERLKFMVDLFGSDKAEVPLSERLPTPEDIHKNMVTYIEGSEIIKNKKEGKWELKGDTEGGGKELGFGRQYFIIYQVMTTLKEMLESDLTKSPPENKARAIEAFVNTQTNAVLNSHKVDIDKAYSRYISAVIRFKIVNLLKTYRAYFIDMYNMYGEYLRGYWFAKPDAKPDYYTYKIKEDNGVQRWIDWKSVEKAGTEKEKVKNYEAGKEKEGLLVELNIYGYSTSDINAIQIERKNLQYIRRYKKNDITFLHFDPKFVKARFVQILEYSHKDYEFYVQDMERGIYHPYSKSIADYSILSQLQKTGVYSYMKFSDATFKKELSVEDIAFDREALKNPSQFIYWGRKNYYDMELQSLRMDPKNPYPTVSLLGLWEFIKEVAVKRVKEPEIAKKFLNEIKSGYGELEKSEAQKPKHEHYA